MIPLAKPRLRWSVYFSQRADNGRLPNLEAQSEKRQAGRGVEWGMLQTKRDFMCLPYRNTCIRKEQENVLHLQI